MTKSPLVINKHIKEKWHFRESPKRRFLFNLCRGSKRLYKPSQWNIVTSRLSSLCEIERKDIFVLVIRDELSSESFRVCHQLPIQFRTHIPKQFPIFFINQINYFLFSFFQIPDPLFCLYVASDAIPESLRSVSQLWYTPLSPLHAYLHINTYEMCSFVWNILQILFFTNFFHSNAGNDE